MTEFNIPFFFVQFIFDSFKDIIKTFENVFK